MPFAVRSIVPPETLLRSTVSPRAFPSAATIMCDDVDGSASAARADAALGIAIAGFARTSERTGARVTHDPSAVGRWENEGGPAAPPAFAALTSERQAMRSREQRAWTAHEVWLAPVDAAVRAYTLALRCGGVPLPTTLIAVAASVRTHATALLPADACAALQRDAARSCLGAYFGA
jgi:hypothetical protein